MNITEAVTRHRRPATRPPTVPEHLTAALDLSRRYEGWLNPPGRPCRCRFCTGTAPTRPPED